MPTGCPQRPPSQTQAAPLVRPATAHPANHVPAGATRTRSNPQQTVPQRVLRPATAHPANSALAGAARTRPTSNDVKSGAPVPTSQEPFASAHPPSEEHALLYGKMGSESALPRTEVVSSARSQVSRDILSAATTNTRGRTSIASAGDDAQQPSASRRARVTTATARSSLPNGHMWEAVNEQVPRPYTAHHPPKARAAGEDGGNSPLTKRATPCLATFELREFLESAASGAGVQMPHAKEATDNRQRCLTSQGHVRRDAETRPEALKKPTPEQKHGAAEFPTRTFDEASVRPTTAPALKRVEARTWSAREDPRGPLLKFREVRTVEDSLRRDRYYARQVALSSVWCLRIRSPQPIAKSCGCLSERARIAATTATIV